MITLQQAKNLKIGEILYHVYLKNKDGSSFRFKVNGKPKMWKRNHNRVRVPIKYGLFSYGELTNGTFEGGSFTVNLRDVCK